MFRRIAQALVALLVLLAAGLPAALASGTTPVLGSKHAFPNGKGFGTVKPHTVFLGGDPTGRVTSITWHGWGATRSTGLGTGWCPGVSVAAGHPCKASLHAYSLGSCSGRRAYRKLAFYFKLHRSSRWTLGSRWNVCSGKFISS
jgi:hypothetical protein